MGVLNVTPDSFSDGGEFFATEAAVEHGMRMAQNGADIIDIGGESTRPGAEPVSPNEELGASFRSSKALAQADAGLHFDRHLEGAVARAALDAGASIINDVTGGRGDRGDVCARGGETARRSSSCTCKARRGRCRHNPHLR